MSSKPHRALIGLALSGLVLLPAQGNDRTARERIDTILNTFVFQEGELFRRQQAPGFDVQQRDERYSELVDYAARELEPFLPEALQVLGMRLGYRTEDQKRLEDLLGIPCPTARQEAEINQLATVPGVRQNLCGLAFVTGRLGKKSPVAAA